MYFIRLSLSRGFRVYTQCKSGVDHRECNYSHRNKDIVNGLHGGIRMAGRVSNFFFFFKSSSSLHTRRKEGASSVWLWLTQNHRARSRRISPLIKRTGRRRRDLSSYREDGNTMKKS